MIRTKLAHVLFRTLCTVGRPFGGVRPRRIYFWLARRAYPAPDTWSWHRDRWGNELRLDPFYLMDQILLAFGEYDPDLHAYIEAHVRPGMVCLDVGANIGGMALHLARRVGPGGKVLAFEPSPPLFARLKENVERNGLAGVVELLPVAVADRPGTMQLGVVDPLEQNQGQGSLVNRANPVITSEVTVPVVSLDELARERALTRVDLMKVDIQGAEMLLLEGAREFLAKFGPDLLMEVSPDDLACIGKTSTDLVALLDELGYDVFLLERSGAGKQLRPSEVAPDLDVDNVLCRRRGRPRPAP